MSKKNSRRRNLNRYVSKPLDGNPASASMFLIVYDDSNIIEKEISDVSEIKQYRGKYRTLWLHVKGLKDIALTNKIGAAFDVHHLALEDVGNVQQRSKVEQYGEQYFVVSHLIKMNQALETTQVSMFVSKEFVVSWQEGQDDDLKSVRDRLHRENSRGRKAGPDYLMYMILDMVIDTYFLCLKFMASALKNLKTIFSNILREKRSVKFIKLSANCW